MLETLSKEKGTMVKVVAKKDFMIKELKEQVKKLSLDDTEDSENTDPNRMALINRDKRISVLE